jgi:hypothetical protein
MRASNRALHHVSLILIAQIAQPISLHLGAFLHLKLVGGLEELQRRIPQEAKILIATKSSRAN